ncbi:hypothetical protein [Streptomyces sp. NPDC001816]|uniref:hypothetical protein n=1 Tax=Streptomyces sp. NPDC001816 TaxID=3364612 RepID=UPI0036A06A21
MLLVLLWKEGVLVFLGFIGVFVIAALVNPGIDDLYAGGWSKEAGRSCSCILAVFTLILAATAFSVFGWLVWRHGILLLLGYVGVAVACELINRMINHQPTWLSRLFAPFVLVPAYLFIKAGLPWGVIGWSHRGAPFDGRYLVAALASHFFIMHAFVYLWKFDNLRHQHRIDEDSEKLLSSIIQGKSETHQSYVLYLRPFFSTAQLPSGAQTSDGKPAQHIDMELVFRRAFKRDRLFVALGKPGEAEGAARLLTSDKNWWNTFVRLAEKADLIVMLPSVKEGTFREARWIRQNGMLEKCLMFMPAMPPASGRIDIYEGPKLPIVRVRRQRVYSYNPAAEWVEAAARYHGIGIELPEYDPRGALVRLKRNGRADEIDYLDLHNHARRASRVRKGVRRLVGG